MANKIVRLLKQTRIIVLIVFIIFALVAISPRKAEGVAIRSIVPDSAAFEAGIIASAANVKPTARERIISINDVKINSVNDYYDHIEKLRPSQTVFVQTNKQLYSLTTKFDDSINKTQDLGFRVYNAPSTNIKLGLDLEGGTSILLKPKKEVTKQDLDILVDNIQRRLNVYGLSDLIVRSTVDLDNNKFIAVEVAGLNQEEVIHLVSQQGKFEAKIKNQTAFIGSDITYVCRTSDCSGINPQRGCGSIGNAYGCEFFLAISLSQKAAQKQAEITANLSVVPTPGSEGYLSENITFYLDGKEVDALRISSSLKGKPVTDIQISGSGSGSTINEARENTLKNMKELQTILITGNLPVELEIVKTDSISPIFGKDLLNNVFLIGFVAIILVSITMFIYYRKIVVSLSIIISMLSEVIMVLGFAAFVGWNLDLAAMAGIIVSIGTGVDDLIIIADEVLKGKAIYNWKQKMKRAFFIVFGAYFATLAAMIPLLFAGAGLIKGFALVTIAGISIGVFIARPAYGKIVEVLLEEKKDYIPEEK